MKKLFILIFILIFEFTLSIAQAHTLINTSSKKEIQLDGEAQAILRKWDSQFKIFSSEDYAPAIVDLFKGSKQELPMAVLGDFNGDQKQDVALMGYSKNKEKIVILVTQKKSYIAVEVQSRDYVNPKANTIESEDGIEHGLSFYISLLPSKELIFKKDKTYLLKPDALQLENYLGQTSAYYLKPNAKKSFDLKEYKGMID